MRALRAATMVSRADRPGLRLRVAMPMAMVCFGMRPLADLDCFGSITMVAPPESGVFQT